MKVTNLILASLVAGSIAFAADTAAPADSAKTKKEVVVHKKAVKKVEKTDKATAAPSDTTKVEKKAVKKSKKAKVVKDSTAATTAPATK